MFEQNSKTTKNPNQWQNVWINQNSKTSCDKSGVQTFHHATVNHGHLITGHLITLKFNHRDTLSRSQVSHVNIILMFLHYDFF